jgi:hypothetical protein
MPTLTITLTDKAVEYLDEEAARALRSREAQATVFILEALKLWPLSRTAKPPSQGKGARAKSVTANGGAGAEG